jgi:hypothetical protein
LRWSKILIVLLARHDGINDITAVRTSLVDPFAPAISTDEILGHALDTSITSGSVRWLFNAFWYEVAVAGHER